jgi:hypothetical protein
MSDLNFLFNFLNVSLIIERESETYGNIMLNIHCNNIQNLPKIMGPEKNQIHSND